MKQIQGTDVIGLPGQNLTDTELTVLVGLADGQTPGQIKQALHTADANQLHSLEQRIRAKLGARTKSHMISRAFILGVLAPRALCFMLAIICTAQSADSDMLRLRSPQRTRTTRQLTRTIRTTPGGRAA
ncbi:hypothetical protein [Pontibacterium sp.]|uniref:hypothetical protein n=1 Tax=Pontibacterium sp. TaxID=2036026 RepID=UPI003562D90A